MTAYQLVPVNILKRLLDRQPEKPKDLDAFVLHKSEEKLEKLGRQRKNTDLAKRKYQAELSHVIKRKRNMAEKSEKSEKPGEPARKKVRIAEPLAGERTPAAVDVDIDDDQFTDAREEPEQGGQRLRFDVSPPPPTRKLTRTVNKPTDSEVIDAGAKRLASHILKHKDHYKNIVYGATQLFNTAKTGPMTGSSLPLACQRIVAQAIRKDHLVGSPPGYKKLKAVVDTDADARNLLEEIARGQTGQGRKKLDPGVRKRGRPREKARPSSPFRPERWRRPKR